MIELLQQNTLLLLFLVIAIGYAMGNITFRNTSLGLAAVLFVGLFFGSLDMRFKIPEIIILLGLAMFVYSIGLASGPAFFNSFKQYSKSNFRFSMLVVGITVLITLGLYVGLDLSKVSVASIYSGSFTNTPALAALLDAIAIKSDGAVEQLQKEAVIGYSLTYPMGVIAAMLAYMAALRIVKVDLKAEEEKLRTKFAIRQNIENRLIEIVNDEAVGMDIRTFKQSHPYKMIFGRLFRNGERLMTNYDTVFQKGDRVVVVADEEDLEAITALLGSCIETEVEEAHPAYTQRRIFVSNPEIAGQQLSTLNINQKFSAIITRITRGDNELLAMEDTTLELGDRVRVLGRRKDIPKIKAWLGDSYDALSHINLLSFGLGLAIGLMLGMLEIKITDDLSFSLGYAGGPLLVALILGYLRRTGNIVWSLPYSANLTLQQIGLTLLLAGIGVNSGHAFFETLGTSQGLVLFAAGTILTFFSTFFVLIFGYKLLKIPFSLLMGMAAGQPAVLDFAQRRTNNKIPTIGYTLMLPIMLIIKLLIVQLLFALL